MNISAIKNIDTGLFLGQKGNKKDGPEWVSDISKAYNPQNLTSSMIVIFGLGKNGFNVEMVERTKGTYYKVVGVGKFHDPDNSAIHRINKL